jgi:hypothetical protein
MKSHILAFCSCIANVECPPLFQNIWFRAGTVKGAFNRTAGNDMSMIANKQMYIDIFGETRGVLICLLFVNCCLGGLQRDCNVSSKAPCNQRWHDDPRSCVGSTVRSRMKRRRELTHPLGMTHKRIQSASSFCPVAQNPQKYSCARYNIVLESVMTADVNPIMGATGDWDPCARYT